MLNLTPTGRRGSSVEKRRQEEVSQAAREVAKEERRMALEAANARCTTPVRRVIVEQTLMGAKAAPEAPLDYEVVQLPEVSPLVGSSLGGVFHLL